MNFLAHAFLSGDNPFLLQGNLIADILKRDIEHLDPSVQKGVHLHRDIDRFTDQHASFIQSVRRIRADHRHFSPVIIDIFYDYFLANNFHQYSDQSLECFVDDVALTMSTAEESISSLFNARINRMQWLLDYKTEAGIRTALERLNRRSRYGVDIDSAMQNLNEHRQEIESDFQSFFPDIIAFTDKKIRALS